MQPGIYEARSVDHPERVAYVVLEDAAANRRRLHVARAALGVLRWRTQGSTKLLVKATLDKLEQP